MFLGRFFATWGAYVVIAFILGYAWHLKAFKMLYRRLGIYSRLEDPIIPLGLLSMLVQGAVLAYLYPRMVGSDHHWHDTFHFSLSMGLFLASAAVFAEAAKQRVTSLGTWLVVESLYYLVQFSLVAVAFYLIYAG